METHIRLKFGCDIHGVIDRRPEIFAELFCVLIGSGHEVHVLTGSTAEDAKKELDQYGIQYTHLFSITDYHASNGTPVTHYEDGRPCFASRVWDKTKAEYCKEHGLHIHLDDTMEYAKYFRDQTFFGYFPRLGK